MNFKDFKNFDHFYDSYGKLNPVELQSLKDEVMNWTDEELHEGIIVFRDYYGLEVPTSLLRNILKNDISLAYEVYTGGIGDTDQRERLMDLLLKHMNLSKWPIYGDSEEYKESFKKSLLNTILEYGIVANFK